MGNVLQAITKIAIMTFIVSSMLAMGLGLTLRAILSPLRQFRVVAIALLLNFVLAPAIAYGLTVVVPLARPYAIGLLLLSGAAGAPFLPKLAEVARGDLAFSISLMALLTIGSVLFMPFVLPLLIPGFAANPWAIAKPLIFLIALPLVVGMVVHRYTERFAGRCRPPLGKISNVSLLLVIVLLIGLHLGALVGVVGSGAIAVAMVFVVLLFIVGYWLGGPSEGRKGVMGLGSAMRNIAAALPAAGTQSDPQVLVMLVVGAIVSLVLSLGMVAWLRRRVTA
jgi:BASS family bile acid:Na+ symporter